MSKFKVGDPVRVTSHKHKYFDHVGVIVAINEGPMTVKFADGKHYWLGEHNLTLADPDVHEVLAEMAEQSGLDKESAPCITAEQWDKAVIAPDPVSAPSHYRSHPSGIETITITRHESFLRGNVLKYVLRAPYKGSEVQDLRKAAQYLQWEIERAEAAQ